VLRKIEALDFIARGDTKPDRFVDEKKQNKGPDDRDGPGDPDSSELVQHLVAVSFE
jgi:hypothetical protein